MLCLCAKSIERPPCFLQYTKLVSESAIHKYIILKMRNITLQTSLLYNVVIFFLHMLSLFLICSESPDSIGTETTTQVLVGRRLQDNGNDNNMIYFLHSQAKFS